MIAAVEIRSLRASDIPALTEVLARAYDRALNVESRLRSYLGAPDIATFVADLGGVPVGMVIGSDYGPVAYVAQMAVDPQRQRRGIGTALMDALIAWADARGIPAVELDATAAGAKLYARYGFVEDGRTDVYVCERAGGAIDDVRRFEHADLAELCATDARAFGADRSAALRPLVEPPNTVFVAPRAGAMCGYAVAQPHTESLGPVIAPDARTAARLVDAARTRLPAGHRMSIPSHNAAARQLALGRAYRLTRSLSHLVRGRNPGPRGALYARINLGQG